MTQNLAPFAAVGALINQGVSQLLSNATATWQGGGQAFGVIFQKGTDDGFVDGVVTTVRHTVSMCVANAPGIAEGCKGLRINGQLCVVNGAVVPDASGWATFPIFFEWGS